MYILRKDRADILLTTTSKSSGLYSNSVRGELEVNHVANRGQTLKIYRRAPKYAYVSWYILIFSWMQGIAVLHITLLICTLLSLPFIPNAVKKLKSIPWVYIPVVSYEAIRLLSAVMSEHPDKAFIGIFDDFRAITFGFLTLLFLNNRKDLKYAAWITFSGFTSFAYWVLLYHLYTHHGSLQPTIDIHLGTLGSVNYAAAIYAMVMLSMITAAIILPRKYMFWMVLGIIPFAILQIPLGSRTTMMVTVILCLAIILFLRAWKAMLPLAFLGMITLAFLAFTPTGLSQFSSLAQSKEQITGHGGIPSIQIRWEIFQVLAHLSLQHTLGLGPKNHIYVNLNHERKFLKEHAKAICRYVYGFTTDSKQFRTFNFNHPTGSKSHPFTSDPHSQYTIVLSETGPIGCFFLLMVFAGILRYSIPMLAFKHDIQQKLLALSGITMLSVFLLSGLTVVLIYQAGNLMLFGYMAALASNKNFSHTNVLDTR